MRSLSETPMAGRRPIPNSTATSNGPAPPPPIPALRKTASSSNLSATNGMTSAQVISLAREAMRNALESESQVSEVGAVGVNLKPGVTVDLSRKHIQILPEEVVDIVKNELERLVKITSITLRSEKRLADHYPDLLYPTTSWPHCLPVFLNAHHYGISISGQTSSLSFPCRSVYLLR